MTINLSGNTTKFRWWLTTYEIQQFCQKEASDAIIDAGSDATINEIKCDSTSTTEITIIMQDDAQAWISLTFAQRLLTQHRKPQKINVDRNNLSCNVICYLYLYEAAKLIYLVN